MKEFQGRFSGEWGWETVQQITSNENHDCSGKFSNQFDSKGSPILLPKFGSEFLRTKSFCFENWIFYSHSAYAYVRESVRTRDMGWSCRHSSRFMKLLECVCFAMHLHLGGE